MVGRGGGREVATHDFHAGAQRLLTQDVLVRVDGLDGLLGVHRCHRRYHHRLQALVLQHLVVVRVQLGAVRLQVLLAPCDFFLVGTVGGDQLGARCAVEEVEGVTGAHAAEAGDGDLEAAGGHYWGD